MSGVNNEIVWVYGGSGAGKETFIRTVSGKRPADLINRLGWKGKRIIPCLESIEWVAEYKGDPKGERRQELLSIIVELAAKPNSVILIKGQDLDLLADRLRKVKMMLSQYRHRIIFIRTAVGEVYERLKRKSWWKDYYTKKDVKNKIEIQIKKLKDLQSEFEITAVSGGAGKNYKSINFLPGTV